MNSRQDENAGKLTPVRAGMACDILLTGEALTIFQEVNSSREPLRVKQAAQMRKRFEAIADIGPSKLPDTQFKKEGTFPCGAKDGSKATVFTIKAWQFRIYGILTNWKGRRAFIGFRADRDKKQNKADRSLLKATAKDAAPHIDGGKK
jgi:hypothetical protein